MRNLKKFLSLLLAVMMVATAGIIVSAEETPDYTEAENVLAKIGVFKGYGDNNYGWDENISRVQMALLLSRMMTGKINDEDEKYWENVTETCVFEDMVTDSYDYTAYTGAVMYCYLQNIIKGTSTTEMLFNPQGKITLDEAITFICRALGYDSDVWPVGFRMFADEHGILNNISANWKDELTRAEIAQLLYNMINVISGNDIGAAEWPYPGDDFAMFDEFSVESVVKNGKFINEFRNEGEIVYSVDCPITENAPAASVVYDAAGKAVDTAAKDYVASDYTHEANYILYDGSIVELVLEGAYNATTNKIDYADVSDELTVEELRFVSYNETTKVLAFVDAEENEVELVLNTKVLAGKPETKVDTLTKNTIYTVVSDANGIIEIEGDKKVESGLAIFKGVELEYDAEGNTTGNLVVTVLPYSNGFTADEKIVVRSIKSTYLNYTNVWEDDLTDDDTTHDVGIRGNDLYEAYDILTKQLKSGAWLVNVTKDSFGKFDISSAETYYGEFAAVNEFDTENVLAFVDGMVWDDRADKDGVRDDGEVKNLRDNALTNEAFFAWVDADNDHVYDAVGETYTIKETDTFVVVNQKTGKVSIFNNRPTTGMFITGEFASKTLVDENGYIVVVTNPTDEVPFDLEPRDTFVQVSGLKGKTEQHRNVYTLGGYNIPVYTYTYTISGMTNYATGEAETIVFEGLTEAQYLAIKAEMSTWRLVLEDDFIYRLFDNRNADTTVVPFMGFINSTFAEFWEEYDKYDISLPNVPGRTLLNKQDLFFALFEVSPVEIRDIDHMDDLVIKYNELDDVDYLDYISTDKINKDYIYDIGLDYDEETNTLYVDYVKVGARVEIMDYAYDADNDGVIEDNEKNFHYIVEVDMPGYGYDGDKLVHVDDLWPEEAFFRFGTNLYIVAEDNIIRDTVDVKIKVGGKEQTITLKNGKIEQVKLDELAEIAIPHADSFDLENAIDVDNDLANDAAWSTTDLAKYLKTVESLNEATTKYVYWDSHENLSVRYQTFDINFRGIYLEQDSKQHVVDIDASVEELDKWDHFNVYDWIMEYAEIHTDAHKAPTAWGKESYINLTDDGLDAKWYTYGMFVPYVPGNTAVEDLSGDIYRTSNGEWEAENYYFVEYSWEDYKADRNADEPKGIQKVVIVLKPGYVTLNLSEVLVADCNCGQYVNTADGYNFTASETKCVEEHECGTEVDLLFINAVKNNADTKKPELIDYDEDLNKVLFDDEIAGYVNDAHLVGGFYYAGQKAQEEVKMVNAHNWYELSINAKRDAELVESEAKPSLEGNALENLLTWYKDEEAREELGETIENAFWAALLEIYYSIWGIDLLQVGNIF